MSPTSGPANCWAFVLSLPLMFRHTSRHVWTVHVNRAAARRSLYRTNYTHHPVTRQLWQCVGDEWLSALPYIPCASRIRDRERNALIRFFSVHVILVS